MVNRLLSVTPQPGMKLLLRYASGENRLFDASPYARGSWYGELRDPDYFDRVTVLPDGSGIEWPEGQDIAPHELYELGTVV